MPARNHQRRTLNARQRRARRKAVFERYAYRCAGCGEQFPPDQLTLDHIIPIAAGGHDRFGNLQPMCSPCNQEKADTVPEKIELHSWHPERVGARRIARAA